ncbi:MAG: hypothetical protein ACM3SO_16560 [Betaproteobacteria bacterium]
MENHKRTRALARWLLLLLCMFAGIAQADRAKQWSVVELGAFNPQQGSASFGVNNRGDAVGRSFIGCCAFQHAFFWRNGTMLDINPPGNLNSRAWAVNNNGTAVIEGDSNRIYTWRDGEFTLLPFAGFPNDINNGGAVTGGWLSGTGTHAFIYKDGVLTDLGTLGGQFSAGNAVNNDGVVVGGAAPSGFSPVHAFAYMDGAMRDLGTLGGAASTATDVNDDGVVVGRSQDASGQLVAFAWDAAQGMRTLPVPGANNAVSINNRGDIVGTSSHGSFLLSDGAVTMLDAIAAVKAGGYSLVVPDDINERGWIAGTARIANRTVAILLIPQ